MRMDTKNAVRWGLGALALTLAASGGYLFGQHRGSGREADAAREILYWYDPMVPREHYDNPNSLSSMGMKTIPKYAVEETVGTAREGVKIDPSARQNLGLRIATAEIGVLPSAQTVVGTIDFNQRNVAMIQSRSGGFVTRVYGRAPGDVIAAGAPIADVQFPEWGGAQTEYLAVSGLGKPELTAAARRRLRLVGMPEGQIALVERTGRMHDTITITSPIAGVIQVLDVRTSGTLAQGQTLAQVTGIGTVWLNAAIPQASAGNVRVGQLAHATLVAYPDETFAGRIVAVLPAVQSDSHTLTARIELTNRGRRLRPGMFASVTLDGDQKQVLLVPSEAVIRTGARTLVILALDGGRYRPAEVRIGRESGGKTEIIQGLLRGETVVVSGQFLLDSEASLTGIPARSLEGRR